jgi:aspartyl-tRNA(Asn)/glutamyl-tRNA(Gln) amidotransferase subunit C
MSLTVHQVEKVSLLARLQLTEAELATMTEQLGAIVGYVELLSELDTADVEPMSHPLEFFNVFRDDQIRPSLDRQKMLSNAPHANGEFYLVPAVLGD